MGCIYDSWSEQFDNNKWMQAFDNTGIEIGFYNLRERAEEEERAETGNYKDKKISRKVSNWKIIRSIS